MSLIFWVRVKLLLVLLLMLAACSTTPTNTQEKKVTKRVMAHQQALLENDMEKAYKFLSPGYRKTRSFKEFLATKGSTIKRVSSEVDSVTCDEDACTVYVTLYYKYQGIAGFHTKPDDPPVSRAMKERWIKVDGQWWLYREL